MLGNARPSGGRAAHQEGAMNALLFKAQETSCCSVRRGLNLSAEAEGVLAWRPARATRPS